MGKRRYGWDEAKYYKIRRQKSVGKGRGNEIGEGCWKTEEGIDKREFQGEGDWKRRGGSWRGVGTGDGPPATVEVGVCAGERVMSMVVGMEAGVSSSVSESSEKRRRP